MEYTLLKEVNGMFKEQVRFKKKSQVTIPKEIVVTLGLKEGDILECRLEDGKIVIVPTVQIPKDQAWFWTKEWQGEEKEVDEWKSAEEVREPKDANEILDLLDRLSKK